MPIYSQPAACRGCQERTLRAAESPLSALRVGKADWDTNAEPTPTIAVGATMVPEVVHTDWLKRPVPIDVAKVRLPTKEEIADSLWMTPSDLESLRSYASYECHDLRIAYINGQSSELMVLYCQRVEPHKDPESLRKETDNPFASVETAPINGFNWPIGGRRLCPKPGSPLEGRFTIYHSALLKAQQEAGVTPFKVIGMYDLGVGRTEFQREMHYLGHGHNNEGLLAYRDQVIMPAPQRTVNKNFVILVNEIDFCGDSTVKNGRWISASEFSDPVIRSTFCSYEQQFLRALFDGWHEHRPNA